jgi:hypothetical protein
MKSMERDGPAGWERATWEGSRRAVLREGSEMTFPQKLDWLEQAHRLAERLAAGPRDAAPIAGAEGERP